MVTLAISSTLKINEIFPQIVRFYNYSRYSIVTADIDEGFIHSAATRLRTLIDAD